MKRLLSVALLLLCMYACRPPTMSWNEHTDKAVLYHKAGMKDSCQYYINLAMLGRDSVHIIRKQGQYKIKLIPNKSTQNLWTLK